MTPKRALGAIVAAAVLAVLGAGCGGSSLPDSVNGCAIQPATSCPNGDLSGADISGADLSGANLSGANLEDTNLSGGNLTEANLTQAQIVNADLSDADLTRANLTGATITGSNLDGATLCGTTRTDGTTDDSSCPASTETTGTTETTTTTSTFAEAEVTSFDVGDYTCTSGATQASVTVSWETTAATAVTLSVDGQPAGSSTGYGPTGSAQVGVPCDDQTHQISITPESDAGMGQSETKEVG